MFERRKHIGDIGQAILRPGLGQDLEAVGPLAAGNPRLPFAVAAVEHQDRVARREPQHIAEIVALVPLQRDRLAGAQGGVDEQAGGARSRVQAYLMFQSAPFLA